MRSKTLAMVALALAAAALPSNSLAEITAQGSVHSIEIRGARSMLPLAQHVAEAYMAAHPEATISIAAGTAHRGLKSLLVGTAEMAMSTDVVPEGLAKYAAANKITLEKTLVYADGVVAVVSPKNPVTNLSRKQLREIFRGRIKNWKEVSGNDAPIVLTTQVATSATFEVLKTQVLGEDAVISPAAKYVSNDEMRKVIGEDEKAIGYTNSHDVGSLKPLTIDGVAASNATIKDGTYPIRRKMCLWVRAPASPIAKALLEAFRAPAAKDFVRSLGDVPAE